MKIVCTTYFPQCLNTDGKTPTETGLVSTGKRSVAKGAKRGRGTGLLPAQGQGPDQGQGRDVVATLQDHPTLQTAGAGAAVSVAAQAGTKQHFSPKNFSNLNFKNFIFSLLITFAYF